jgi:hypothetical protein
MLGDDADKYHCSLRLSGNDLTLPALIRAICKWIRWTGIEKYAKGMQPLFLEKQETGGPKSDDRRDGSSGTGIERPSNPAARAVGVREDAQTREVCGPDEILLQVVGAVRLARAQHLVAPGPHGGEYEPENVVARTPGGVATDDGSERAGFLDRKAPESGGPEHEPDQPVLRCTRGIQPVLLARGRCRQPRPRGQGRDPRRRRERGARAAAYWLSGGDIPEMEKMIAAFTPQRKSEKQQKKKKAAAAKRKREKSAAAERKASDKRSKRPRRLSKHR